MWNTSRKVVCVMRVCKHNDNHQTCWVLGQSGGLGGQEQWQVGTPTEWSPGLPVCQPGGEADSSSDAYMELMLMLPSLEVASSYSEAASSNSLASVNCAAARRRSGPGTKGIATQHSLLCSLGLGLAQVWQWRSRANSCVLAAPFSQQMRHTLLVQTKCNSKVKHGAWHQCAIESNPAHMLDTHIYVLLRSAL